jgi:hypothetical protein
MLYDKFCEYLEWEIGRALEELSQADVRLKGFWCDGVLLPYSENDYSKKAINDRRYVVMTAWAGKTGQEEYELTLLFGRKALSRYERDLSLEGCLPSLGDSSWLEVDPEKKKIAVQLD